MPLHPIRKIRTEQVYEEALAIARRILEIEDTNANQDDPLELLTDRIEAYEEVYMKIRSAFSAETSTWIPHILSGGVKNRPGGLQENTLASQVRLIRSLRLQPEGA